MLLLLLINLLTLTSTNPQPTLTPPPAINEVIKINQVQGYPKSLGIKITAKSALVLDATSQKILFQENSQEIRPIASLTKLMASLVALDSGLDLQKTIEYTSEDNILPNSNTNNSTDPEPSLLNLTVGEKIKIKDLFAASLIKSANNAIQSLVRQIVGTEKSVFVNQMNVRAKEIGMPNTIFVEPTGLDQRNVSTAEDLAKLVQQFSAKPQLTQFMTVPVYSLQTQDKYNRAKTYQLKNTNKLLGNFLKFDVAKTGYLNEAGYCFAGLVEYQQRKIIIILLGSQSEESRFQEVKALAWWAAKQPSI